MRAETTSKINTITLTDLSEAQVKFLRGIAVHQVTIPALVMKSQMISQAEVADANALQVELWRVLGAK